MDNHSFNNRNQQIATEHQFEIEDAISFYRQNFLYVGVVRKLYTNAALVDLKAPHEYEFNNTIVNFKKWRNIMKIGYQIKNRLISCRMSTSK